MSSLVRKYLPPKVTFSRISDLELENVRLAREFKIWRDHTQRVKQLETDLHTAQVPVEKLEQRNIEFVVESSVS
jgi:hypothetical protein